MLPTKENDGQPHRDLTTFRVHDGERIFIGGEDNQGVVHELVRVEEPGQYAVMPLPDDLEARIVDPTQLEGDVAIGEMRVVGEAVGIQERDQATAELRVDGRAVSNSGARGAHAHLWIPLVPER